MKKKIINFIAKIGRIMVPQENQKDLRVELNHLARRQSAEYVSEKMGTVPSVDSDLKVHDIAINAAKEEGLVLEFGVFSGRTINYIASKRNWIVNGFDSFDGLPEFWRDGFEKGHFAVADLPQINSNVRLHKGWFDKTITPFLKNCEIQSDFIAYMHVDCDLYGSTVTIFEQVGHLIKSGSVIVFDEYFNYPGWKDGEWKAFQEFVDKNLISYKYIAYNCVHEQVAIIVE
jgi:hypothetical protein